MILTGQFAINGEPINISPIDGSSSATPVPPVGMTVQVVDCRNLIVRFTDPSYNHFEVLRIQNWGLSLGGWVNAVQHIEGDFYAVNTTRTLAGVTYTIVADV